MNKEGFYHRDIHSGNIMCDEKMKKWFIIDYGAIYHESFIKNTDDKFMGVINNDWDVIFLIWYFIENPIGNYLEKHKIQYPPLNKFIKHITDDDRYITIKKYLPNKKEIKNDCIALICCLLFYDLYIGALGMTNTSVGQKYKDYKQDTINSKYYLNIIKNQ